MYGDERVTIEEYQRMSYEEYKIQCTLKCRLKEWAAVVYFRVPKVTDTVNELLRLGVYLQRDKEQGYIMRPVVGNGHWNKTQWKEFTTGIAKDDELMKSIEEMFSKLSSVGNKPMYSKSCSMKTCFRAEWNIPLENSCYMSDCKYAAEKFEEVIRKQYEKMKHGDDEKYGSSI